MYYDYGGVELTGVDAIRIGGVVVENLPILIVDMPKEVVLGMPLLVVVPSGGITDGSTCTPDVDLPSSYTNETFASNIEISKTSKNVFWSFYSNTIDDACAVDFYAYVDTKLNFSTKQLVRLSASSFPIVIPPLAGTPGHYTATTSIGLPGGVGYPTWADARPDARHRWSPLPEQVLRPARTRQDHHAVLTCGYRSIHACVISPSRRIVPVRAGSCVGLFEEPGAGEPRVSERNDDLHGRWRHRGERAAVQRCILLGPEQLRSTGAFLPRRCVYRRAVSASQPRSQYVHCPRARYWTPPMSMRRLTSPQLGSGTKCWTPSRIVSYSRSSGDETTIVPCSLSVAGEGDSNT